MSPRIHYLLWCSLGLASCDKPQETSAPPRTEASATRVTKVPRTTATELPSSREPRQASFQSANEIENSADRIQALAALAWDSLELDPTLAQQAFQQLPSGCEEKNQLIQHFAMRLAESDLEEALKWAPTLKSDEEKSLAIGKIAMVMAQNEPERAAHLLSESGVPGRDLDVAVVQVTQRWAASDPASAAEWVLLFSDGEARGACLKAITTQWSQDNPQAAFAWLGSIQDQAIQQEALFGMAEILLDQPLSRQEELLQLAAPELRSYVDALKAKASAPTPP